MNRFVGLEIEWFITTMKSVFYIDVDPNNIGHEGTELYIYEVEDFYVPSELFEEVPESLLYEMMVYDDELDNLWVGAVAFYPNSPDGCLQVITKNGEVGFRKVLNATN